MQFSRFFRYENWVVQKMIVRLLLSSTILEDQAMCRPWVIQDGTIVWSKLPT